jgi:protein TonB
MGAVAFAPDRFSAGILKLDRYRGIRTAGVLGAILVHAAALPMLIEGESVPAVQSPQAAPVMVDLISMTQPQTEPAQAAPKPPEPIKPKTETPKPKAKPKPKAVRPSTKRPPILSTPNEAAVQQATAEPAPSPTKVPTETAPASVPPPSSASAPASSPAPAPVVPPRFNAAYLHNPPPVYPVLSRRKREQGKVVLRVLVSAGGGAEQVAIRTSSGFERLDAAALETVKQWKFVPARQGDRSVPAWVLVPISFSLEG